MAVPTEVINTVWYICIYSLMAIPLTLSYRISKIMNFAHGIYITLGAYAPILIITGLKTRLSPIVVIPAAFIVGAAIGITTHILVFSPLIKRKSNPVTLMIASMGAWIFIKYALYALLDILGQLWSTSLFYTTPNIDFPTQVNIFGADINTRFLLVVVLTIISFAILTFFLTKTKLGMGLRAIADNSSLAEISGISIEKGMLITWLISGGLAGIGGFAWSLFTYVSPEAGDTVILQIFACAVIGGLTSLPLTFVGSLIIASAENLLILFLYQYFGLGLSFRPFLSFFALIMAILIRPPAGAGGGLPYRFRLKSLFKKRLK